MSDETASAAVVLLTLCVFAVVYALRLAYLHLKRTGPTDTGALTRRLHSYMKQPFGARGWPRYSVALVAILVAAFAYYVWPTPWRYLRYESRRSTNMLATPMRVHRITGETQVFYPSQGWTVAGQHKRSFFSKLWRKLSGRQREEELRRFLDELRR